MSREPASQSHWKKGFEIELLAPPGRSRRDMAERIAHRIGGEVRPCFYPQSEPSLVPGLPVFENLILGFEVLTCSGTRHALLVDDLTLRADLDRDTPPLPDWFRVLSDDARILALVEQHCSATAPLEGLLEPLAQLFGTGVETPDPQVYKVNDAAGRSVAMATSLPGERERPCEIITAPIETDARPALKAFLDDAVSLGFTVPREAAVHVHFDGEKLCSARVLSRLLLALDQYRYALRERVRTNPACVRLGPTDPKILDLLRTDAFLSATWPDARAMLAALKPTKYCDFNIANLVFQTPGKHTFEVRILPGSMSVDEISANAELFEAILNWAAEGGSLVLPDRLDAFLAQCGEA